jgi:nickel superoxide dismutase
MKTSLFSLVAIALVGTLATTYSPAAPLTNAPFAPSLAPFHCQVPCGIYGDKMRMDMLMEDSATIEKAMTTLETEGVSQNQMVRWIMNKEEHAAKIQETVASYWLAQRIKTPADATNEAAMAKYHRQLELLHGITVAAMKCKQTTDVANVEGLRNKAMEFSGTYFSEEDQKHLRDHTFAK